MKVAAWANAAAPTPARAARSEAERAERGTVQMRPCTPLTTAPPARDGSCKLAEDPSVPEGQPKSEQAPIRRPPSRAEGHCTGARLAPFSLPPGAAHSLFGQDQKENGGRIPRGNGPLREQNPPGGRLPPLRHLRKKAPLWGRGEKKRRPAFRPAALRSAVTPKIPSGSGPPPPPR